MGVVALLLLLLLLVVACGGAASATLVTYERDWPDGYHEELSITDDGHVTMHHGDVLERLTLTTAQVQRVKDVLAAGVPKGDKGDSLVRTVVLANGTSVTPVDPVAGSSVELLELLMTTHSMDGAPITGASPALVHSLGPGDPSP